MAGEEGGGGKSLRPGGTGLSWRLNRSTGHEVDQEQQDDGANGGADDLADNPRKMQIARQSIARDDRAENAHDDVPDQPNPPPL